MSPRHVLVAVIAGGPPRLTTPAIKCCHQDDRQDLRNNEREAVLVGDPDSLSFKTIDPEKASFQCALRSFHVLELSGILLTIHSIVNIEAIESWSARG